MWLRLTVLVHGQSKMGSQLINMDHAIKIEDMSDRTRIHFDDGMIEVSESAAEIWDRIERYHGRA